MKVMDATFFTQNRAKLRQAVETPLIVIAGHDEVHRRADAAFNFVQDANFFYLTGINEAEWKLVMEGDEVFLVAPQRSESQTLFEGSLLWDDARAISGIRQIIDTEEWAKRIVELGNRYGNVATVGEDPHRDYYGFTPNSGPIDSLTALRKSFAEVKDIRSVLAAQRAIKQPAEIAKMQRAIDITIQSFKNVRDEIEKFDAENNIAARLSYDFLDAGAEGHAYDPIVASGKAACTLHYVKNNAPLKSGDLVLIDAGAEYGSYAADITRTYALGQPSDRQVKVHAAVQGAHEAIINLIKPGVSFADYSKQVDEIMVDALKALYLYKNEDDYRKYFPHAISHGLGIDVHESLGGFKEFKPGMVLTVEPGIYIPEESIGVRIEDDILVTETGNKNLSGDLSTAL